jgi:hypothetical protein
VAQLRTGSGMAGEPSYDPRRGRLYAMSNRGMFVALRVGEALAADEASLVAAR